MAGREQQRDQKLQACPKRPATLSLATPADRHPHVSAFRVQGERGLHFQTESTNLPGRPPAELVPIFGMCDPAQMTAASASSSALIPSTRTPSSYHSFIPLEDPQGARQSKATIHPPLLIYSSSHESSVTSAA